MAEAAIAKPGLGAVDPAPDHVDFAGLLGRDAWRRLPAAVRARFTARAEVTTYEGEMRVEASTPGFLFAQACRLIGRPLAPWRGEAVPVSVTVWTDPRGALVWDRLYRFERRRPTLVSSRKVADHRGLVEIVRCGLGMALDLTVEDGALHFRSRRYFLQLGELRAPIPMVLTPGRAHVVHRDEGSGRFRFTLAFDHPWFGRTLFQDGSFSDPV